MKRVTALALPLLAALVVTGAAAQEEQEPPPRPGPEREHEYNPCLDESLPPLRCPDLVMGKPRDFSIQRTRGGRRLLRMENRIYNLGRGPVEVAGRRRSRLTMFARQRIHRADGAKMLAPKTEARLDFYYIPGQGRWWKFRDAAVFELWTLGEDRRRVRRGEKQIYCFRDLRRTHPRRRFSPKRRVYPACSQDAGRKRITLGTSVGWADIYPASYYENYIDVTGLRGCFAVWHIVDPENRLFESRERNNATRQIVELPYRGHPGRCRNR